MTTILRTYKYINFFTGYYLKTCQSNYSPLKCVLKSSSAAMHSNRNLETAAVTSFKYSKSILSPSRFVENIKERYLLTKSSMYTELALLLKSIHNKGTWVQPASIGLLIEKDIQMLILCCGKAMKAEMPSTRAKLLDNFWQLFKTTGLPLNLSHYNALLSTYLENDQDFSPAEILLEMNNNGIQPNELTYEYLLTHYCQKGNIEEANKILNFLKESEIPLNENIFNALIIGNAQANGMSSAVNILSIMKTMGCQPSSKTYAALLAAYAKKGDIENILKTLRSCESQDVIILDKYKMDIVYYLALTGHKEHINKILSAFSWDTSFQTENKNFISKLMDIKEIDVAIEVLLAAKNAGIPENQLIATAQPFSRNIVKLDLPEEKIIKSLNLLEKEGFNMYEDSLHHCADNKITKYSVSLLKAWSKMGFHLKEPIFWPFLANYGSENVKGVLEILQLMRNEFEINPSFETLTHFVLPYIKNSSSREIIETLISNLKIPADLTVNAILYHDLSKNKIENAAKCLKNSADYNINYNKKLLFPLLEKALQKTDDINSYNFIKTQIQRGREIRSKKENQTEQGFYLLPTMHTIDLGFKLKKYSDNGDLASAKNCMNELKRYRECKLSLDKLLSYFNLLVKNNKLEDALQLLQDFSEEGRCIVWYNKETRDQCKSSLNLLAEKGLVDGVNELYDFLSKKQVNGSLTFAGSLVEVHLSRNDPKAAFKSVKKIQNLHGQIPARTKLMKALIDAEEIESLQWLTDFSIQFQGESVTLLPLAVAFLKSKRVRQCKRILESANSPFKDTLVRNCVNTFFMEDDISSVKDFIQATQGLVSINRNILYEMLLEKYSVNNNWEEGLALWKQMENENFTPSELFLVLLEELLKRNDQSVPFSMPKSVSEAQDDFYTKVAKIYLKTQSYPIREFLDRLVENLVETGNTKMIEAIENNWQQLYGQYLRNKPIRFEAYVKANKVDDYLNHINKSLKTGNNVELMKFVKTINHNSVKYLLSHPESIDLFESLVSQISLEQKYFKPTLIVLSYYFLKDDSKGQELWNKSPSKLHQSYSAYSFLVKSFVATDNFDKLPHLAEILHKCKIFNKRMFYETFLTAYVEQNKYEEGVRVLAKFRPKPQELNREKLEYNEEINDIAPVKSQLAL